MFYLLISAFLQLATLSGKGSADAIGSSGWDNDAVARPASIGSSGWDNDAVARPASIGSSGWDNDVVAHPVAN